MTKRDYIASRLAAVYFDLASIETSYGKREVIKTLGNIVAELERMTPLDLDAPETPSKGKDLEGGNKVPVPVPPSNMPPQGSVNPLEAIRAMTANR